MIAPDLAQPFAPPFVLTAPSGRMEIGGAPKLVGILNVTPDSFFDGGRYNTPDSALRQGLRMFDDGASWVDVGGMSTRPGSDEISVRDEIDRVGEVISGLASARSRRKDKSQPAWISVDTYRAAVAECALREGADAVNDVSGFSLDPDMLAFAAAARVPVVVNHMKGRPKNMQDAPAYDSLWDELLNFFETQMNRFAAAGGREEHLILDPGIGFGKTLEHNIDILRGLDRLHALGRPVFLGCSRKSFIAGIMDSNRQSEIGNPKSPADRLPGSLASAAAGALRGAHFLRVHDVAETAQFLSVFREVCQVRHV